MVLEDPAFFVGISMHGDSAINFAVKAWCKTEDYWTVYYDLLETVKVKFDEEGISTTNLFNKKNNAFPKIFYILIVPLMKLIFMNQEKAALSLLNAINDDYNLNEWSGPRGFLHCWGYPNKQKFDKKVIKDLNNPQIIKFIENEVK